MNRIRKRSVKEREKEIDEEHKTNEITEDLIKKVHSQNIYKMPFFKNYKKESDPARYEDLIFKKFNDKKSVSKILQKTAKLQKNLGAKLYDNYKLNESSGEAQFRPYSAIDIK